MIADPGIYIIRNNLTGQVYVGKSMFLEHRWKCHISSAKNNRSQSYLHRSMRKYGIENFQFEIILRTFDLDFWEKFFIFWFQSYIYEFPEKGFNMSRGGEGNTGFKYSEESKLKISVNHADVSGSKNPMFGKNIYFSMTAEMSKKLKQNI